MPQRTRDDPAHKRVWRITADAPQGEYVDPDEAARKDALARLAEAGWQQSSFDLSMGAEVSDAPETLTPEMFDALFKH
nr:hypothetical protein [uncultured Roseateles sp.]